MIKIDKPSEIVLRYNIIGFSAIVSTVMLYDLLLPYGTHLEAIITGMIIGALFGIIPQITIHKLTSMRKKNHVIMEHEL